MHDLHFHWHTARVRFPAWEQHFLTWCFCLCKGCTLFCPKRFCISIVFNFFWNGFNSQKKWKTKVMHNFGWQMRCIMGCGSGVCCPFGVLHLTLLTAWRLGYKWKYTPMNANSLLRLSFSHKVKCYDVKNEIEVILNISSYKKLDTFYCTSSEFPEEARLRVLASAMFVHWIFLCGEDGYDPFHTCNCRSKWCSNVQTPHE